jgi:hypothetical protein
MLLELILVASGYFPQQSHKMAKGKSSNPMDAYSKSRCLMVGAEAKACLDLRKGPTCKRTEKGKGHRRHTLINPDV